MHKSAIAKFHNKKFILSNLGPIIIFLMFIREETQFLALNEFFDENYRLSSIFRP
jgi:hypothetical protein